MPPLSRYNSASYHRILGQCTTAPGRYETQKSGQHSEELWRLSRLLAECVRPDVGFSRVGRCHALRGHQQFPQGELQCELALGPLRAVR